MSLSRPQRLVLGIFPPSFKARYGDELAALASECDGGWRDTADLVRAAARSWLEPPFCGSTEDRRRNRLQTTTATVFVAWSLSSLAVAVFARAVNDKPVPGLRAWGWTAYAVGSGIFQVTVATALVVGFIYWLKVVIPAWRRRDRHTLVAAGLPAALVTIWLGGTALVALYARHQTLLPHGYQTWRLPGTGAGVLLALYAAFTVGCVVGCTVAARRALLRAQLDDRSLAVAALMSTGAAAALVLVTVAVIVCLTRVLVVGQIGARATSMAITPAVFLAAASVVSVTSAFRALPQLTGPASIGRPDG